MNTEAQFKNIFKQDNKVIPKFNFWYLLIHAPKYTSTLLKWCTYPFVFLNTVGAFSLLYNDISKAIVNPDMGFGLLNLMIPSVGIWISLVLWVGIARDKQKKDAIRDYYIKFQIEYKKNPLNQIWKFNIAGGAALSNKIETLFRGGDDHISLQYYFEFQNPQMSIVVGDMTRLQEPTATMKHGYREDRTVVFWSSLEQNFGERTVISKQEEIAKWLMENLNIDIDPFENYKLKLMYFGNKVLLLFSEVVWSPETKIEIGKYFEPNLNVVGENAPN